MVSRENKGALGKPYTEGGAVSRKNLLARFAGLALLLGLAVLNPWRPGIQPLWAQTSPAPAVKFSNVTQAAGIRFTHFKGKKITSTILEEAGPGVCVADFDRDGYQDIYFVSGRDRYGRDINVRNALYHNNGDGTFTDVTDKAGVSGTAYGLGCVWGDYDNDGYPDLYVTQYGSNVLYHNNGDGTFTDVTAKAGVAGTDFGSQFHTGATFFDYDRDGWLDLYVGGYADFGPKSQQHCSIGDGIPTSCRPAAYHGTPAVLYHNNHDGTFTDVAEKAGVVLGNWSTGATFGDYDGDGRLDIFVPGYVHYDFQHPPIPGTSAVAFPQCEFRGLKVMCGPRGLLGEPDHLFHNNGDGTFTDVSEKAGVGDKNAYYGLTAVFADLNDDGKVDLVVANDSTPNYLYINKGNGTFEDASYASGYALNENGKETASMGIAIGDYLNNGHLDLYNTVFSDDYNPLYRNEGDANFTDVSYPAGIAEVTIPFLGWGDGFLDYDNDGWLDLLTVNGHVYPGVDKSDWGTSFAQRPLLFHNLKAGKFEVVPPVKGTGLASTTVGRGAAFGDLFNDGKIDVVINPLDGPPLLLRNVSPDHHHWLGVRLVGGPKSPRDAIGATVYLIAGGIRQRRDVLSGGSFASSNDQRPHFGLGEAASVDKLEIHWPDGTVQKTTVSAGVDRFYTIEEGKAAAPDGR